jgi:hypothetical protein
MAYPELLGNAYAACKGYYGAFDSFWQLSMFAWIMILWIIANPLNSGLPMVGLGL